jgi:hypothetical protein
MTYHPSSYPSCIALDFSLFSFPSFLFLFLFSLFLLFFYGKSILLPGNHSYLDVNPIRTILIAIGCDTCSRLDLVALDTEDPIFLGPLHHVATAPFMQITLDAIHLGSSIPLAVGLDRLPLPPSRMKPSIDGSIDDDSPARSLRELLRPRPPGLPSTIPRRPCTRGGRRHHLALPRMSCRRVVDVVP